MERSYPPLEDIGAWRAHIEAQNDAMAAGFAALAAQANAGVEELDLSGVPVFSVTPDGISTEDRRVVLEVHGGAMIAGSGAACRAFGLTAIARNGVRTFAVDHRMPPDDPYPAGLDDVVAVYRAMLEDHRPEQVVFAGLSAGANLAAAAILRARDEALPLPAAAVLLSPELDLTESGDSFHTNLGLDMVLTESLMPANLLYAGGHDLSDPYVSPLFGEFEQGFPPTFLSAGTRDLFLSNAVRMHQRLRAAGVVAELHVQEAASHGGFFVGPEAHHLDREVRRFIEEHLSH
jgi:acetyl esterase/lipase